MQKLLALLLVALMSISMVACGEETTSTENNTNQAMDETTTNEASFDTEEKDKGLTFGDTVQDDYFELTLTRAEFAQELNGDTSSDNFMLPVTEGESVSTSVKASDENIYLSFSFEYKYIGKTEKTMGTYFRPHVTYNGEYYFFKDYYIVRQSNVWEILSNDTTPPFGLTSADNNYKPLDSTVYECRGFISVPKEVAENTDASLILTFLEGAYNIR